MRSARFRRYGVVALGIAVTAAIVAACLWLIPAALTRDVGATLTAVDKLKARSDVRSSCVALAAAGVAGLGFILGIRTFNLSRAGQYTERFRQSVDSLASESLPVRLGAIYS